MSDDAVVTLIQRHLRRYPISTFQDVYKLLHQAAFGPGHMIGDKKKALEWIERDLEGRPGDAPAPLIESIHPDDAMMRLHLRPYAARGGDLPRLRDAFVRAAAARPDAPATLARWWDVFCAWAAGAPAEHVDLREARLFGMACARTGWPAMHHSEVYRTTYTPAYRVLTAREAEALLRAQDIAFEAI